MAPDERTPLDGAEDSIGAQCTADDSAIGPDLSALLDGELDPARERDVRRHLTACTHCSERLAGFRAVDQMLSGALLPEVPERLARDIWGAVEKPEADQEAVVERAGRTSPRRHRSIRWGAPLVALAASVALYVAVSEPAIDLEQVPDEELAVALQFDTIQDLEVIANLELIERLDAIGEEI